MGERCRRIEMRQPAQLDSIKKRRWPPFSSDRDLVMISQLSDQDLVARSLIDDAVFCGDSARPIALQGRALTARAYRYRQRDYA
jgi:hypothetical protein